MELLQLKYYVTVVQEGNINRAAKSLGMSQPPISTQIKLLEKQLGCKLFDRGSRSITLTEEGKLLYEYALKILDLTKSAALTVSNCHNAEIGILRIGIVSSMIDYSLNHWFIEFNKLHPKINFEIAEGTTFEIIEQLKNRTIDVALVRSPFSSRGLKCMDLGPSGMIIIGTSKYIDTLPENTGLNDICNTPLIIYKRWVEVLDQSFSQKGIRPYIICKSHDVRTCISWAIAGLGAAIVPADVFTSNNLDNLSFRKIYDLSILAEPTLVTNENGCDTAIGNTFIQYINKKTK